MRHFSRRRITPSANPPYAVEAPERGLADIASLIRATISRFPRAPRLSVGQPGALVGIRLPRPPRVDGRPRRPRVFPAATGRRLAVRLLGHDLDLGGRIGGDGLFRSGLLGNPQRIYR